MSNILVDGRDYLPERAQRTFDRVNWTELSRKATGIHGGASSCNPGRMIAGGCNFVRFMEFNNGDVWVARVPQLPEEEREWTDEEIKETKLRMDSEHATRTYLLANVSLPFPVAATLGRSSALGGDGVGLPWTLMTKLEGEMLVEFFLDPTPEDEAAVAHQVAQIYLALFRVRFPAIGALFIQEDTGEYHIGPPVSLGVDTLATSACPCTQPDGTTWKNALGYHNQWHTDHLHNTLEKALGHSDNWYNYAIIWLCRSLAPAFLCIGGDQAGFPLALPETHLRNFMATKDGDAPPQITGIIDFDGANTVTLADFALPPLYMADSEDGNRELLDYSSQQRTVFLQKLGQLEQAHDPSQPLTKLFGEWRIRWLMQKLVRLNTWADELEFFNYIYRTDEDRSQGMWAYVESDNDEEDESSEKVTAASIQEMTNYTPSDDHDDVNSQVDTGDVEAIHKYTVTYYGSDVIRLLSQGVLRSIFRHFEEDRAIQKEVQAITRERVMMKRSEYMGYVTRKKAEFPELEASEKRLLNRSNPIVI